MEVEGLLELLVLADGLEARVDPDMLGELPAEVVVEVAASQPGEEVARQNAELLDRGQAG